MTRTAPQQIAASPSPAAIGAVLSSPTSVLQPPWSPTADILSPNTAMVLEANLSFELAAATAEQELDALEKADAAAAIASEGAAVTPAATANQGRDDTSASPQGCVDEHSITDAEYLALFSEQAERWRQRQWNPMLAVNLILQLR